MRRAPSTARRGPGGAPALLASLFALAACDAPEPPTRVDATVVADAVDDLRLVAPPTWPCPAGWVPSAWGGCGPAVLLCAPDGGAVDGSCAASDAGAGFRRGAGEAILGAWPERGGAGPPAPDWSPDAGIHECPSGWVLRDDRTCDPMVPERCPAGAEPLPGGACAVEDRCGDAAWPEPGPLPVGARVVRVRAGAGAGADGSERAPFGSLEEAARAAGDNGALLLADGTYPTALRVTGSLTIVGRCTGRAVLQAASTDASEVLRVVGGGTLTLRGVTLRGGATGLFVEGAARASLRSVALEGASGFAAVAHGVGAALTADDVAVRGAAGAAPRLGFAVRAGAGLVARRVALRDVAVRGLAVLGAGSRATLEDALIDGGNPTASDALFALFASDGAVLDASRVVVQRLAGQGVGTSPLGERARVTLRDVVLRDLHAPQDGTALAVLQAINGDVAAERLLVERCQGARAWAAALQGATLDLRDAVLRNGAGPDAAAPVGITASANGAASRVTARGLRIEGARDVAVEVGPAGAVDLDASEIVRAAPAPGFRAVSLTQEGTSVRLRRVRAVDLPGAGVVVEAPGAVATVEDSLFRWSSAPPAGAPAEHPTFLVRGGGALTVARSRLSAPPVFGVAAHGERTTLRLEDAVVERVVGNPGIGLLAAEGAELVALHARVDDARVGLAVVNGASARVDGSLIRGTPAVANPAGVGVLLQGGARASLARSLIERNDIAGVALLGAGTAFDAEDLIVRQMRGDGSPPGALLGVGLVVTQGASATLRRVAVTDVRGAALMAAISASPDGGVVGAAPAALDAEDVFVRRVTEASLGSTANGTSGPMAAGLSAGGASAVSLRRCAFDEGGDGLYVVSRGVSLADIVAARQRACGLRTGVDVVNAEALARATAVLSSARAHCLFEAIGDVSFPLIDL